NYGTHWTPRLYSVWHPTERLTLKGGISTGFKAPSLRASVEGWGQITGGRTSAVPAVIIGNSDLKPEKTTTAEISLGWNNHRNLSTSLTLYQTEFRDMIAEKRICTDTAGMATCHVEPGDRGYKFVSHHVNVDKARIRGVEATLTLRIVDDLKLTTNYTFTHSRQRTGEYAGQPLNQMPKHMINATLNWQAMEDLGLWSRVNYRSHTSDYLSRNAMANSTPGYTFVDVGLNYSLTENLSTGIGVYNVFNKQVTNDTHEVVLDGRRFGTQISLEF